MEDVVRWQAIGLWIFILGSAFFLLSSDVNAATQGTMGRTSTGSIGISVEIPRSVRLIVNDISSSTNQSDVKFCLRVVDFGTRSGMQYYQIGRSSLNFNESEIQSELIRLQNIYRLSQDEILECHDNSISMSQHEIDQAKSSAFVLTLVPE